MIDPPVQDGCRLPGEVPVPLPGWRVACRPLPAFPSRVALHSLKVSVLISFDDSCI